MGPDGNICMNSPDTTPNIPPTPPQKSEEEKLRTNSDICKISDI